MRSAAGIAVVLLIMIVMYVVLGTFFRDEGARRGPGQQSDDPPPAGGEIGARLDSATPRPPASPARYRYETPAPTRFGGSGPFLFVGGAFLTAEASHLAAALVGGGVGLLLLVYASRGWRSGTGGTRASAAPPPQPPLPMSSPATEE